MARDKFTSASAICPYYRAENQNMIYCEGITRGALIHNAFSSSFNKLAKKYKEEYCCDNWKSCRIARMHDEKYNEDRNA